MPKRAPIGANCVDEIGFRDGRRQRLEQHAHHEALGIEIAELRAVDDVALPVGEEHADRTDDTGCVAAGQGQHETRNGRFGHCRGSVMELPIVCLTHRDTRRRPRGARPSTDKQRPAQSRPLFMGTAGRVSSRSLRQLPALIVAHRLLDFLARVHHERTVLHDRLEQRSAGEQDDPCRPSRPPASSTRVAVGQHARADASSRCAPRFAGPTSTLPSNG